MASAQQQAGLVVVILAGGAGTRFWPASTADKPKQFLTLVGDRSLLQLSYDRVKALVPPERVLVITAARFVDTVRAHLPELPAQNVVGEPMRRDTAAAVALAGVLVEKRFGPSRLAVLTADHLITPVADFARALASAAAHVDDGHVYTFGIAPTAPATGYGYLETGAAALVEDGVAHHPVLRFHEKPALAVAQEYVASGRFLWNSGMFVWHTRTLRAALAAHLPRHLEVLDALVDADPALSAAGLRTAFEALPSVSIDKGVMEKVAGVMCVRATFAWSDVGGFPALAEHLPKDAHGNTTRGAVRTHDASNNLVWCEDANEVVALVGVKDLVVVRAGNRTLVVPLSRAEDIKKLVESLPPSEQ